MDLPPFPEKRSKGRIKGIKVNKEQREGKILFDHKQRQFYICKDNKTFGYYDTMTEAYYNKKQLMENNWDINCLKSTVQLKIKMDKIIDSTKERKNKINFCPKCKHRLKINEKECPYCGINIKDYLFKNK